MNRLTHRRPHLSRLIAKAGTAAIAATVLLAVWAGPASAHAQLLKTTPVAGADLSSPPTEIVLTFGEVMNLALDHIEVFGADGHAVATGPLTHANGDAYSLAVQVTSRLAQGQYIVGWHAISQDSHPVSGAFSFGVGTAGSASSSALARLSGSVAGTSTSVEFFEALGQILSFLTLALLVGGAVFLELLWPERWSDARTVNRFFGIILYGAIANFLTMVLIAADGAGKGLAGAWDPTALRAAIDAAYGRGHLIEIALLVAAWLLVMWRLHQPNPLLWRVLGGITVAALCFAPGTEGHAGVGSGVPLALIVTAVHVLAGALWLGGLIMLLVVFRSSRRGSITAARSREISSGFSRLALGYVALIVASGFLEEWRDVGPSWRALTTTTSGLLVLTKIILLLAAIAIAARSRSIVRAARARQVSREDDSAPHDDRRRSFGALRLPVSAEAAVIVVIFVVSSFLIRAAPARTVVQTPLSTTVAAGNSFQVQIVVGSTRVGVTTISFVTQRRSGAIAPLGGIDVSLQAPNRSIPAEALQLDHEGAGTFVARSVSILDPGTWTLQVVLHADLFTDVSAPAITFVAQP